MRRAWIAAILAAGLSFSVGAGEPTGSAPRTWTSRDGQFQVEATLLDCRDGRVTLKKTDGREITVPLDSLRDADRARIEARFPQAGKTAKPSAGAAAGPDFRMWTSRDGQFTTSAKLLKFERGKVHLEKPDGKELVVPFEQLGPDDRQWLKAELARRRPRAETAKKGNASGDPSDASGDEKNDEKNDDPKDEKKPEKEPAAGETGHDKHDKKEPAGGEEPEVTGQLGAQSIEMALASLMDVPPIKSSGKDAKAAKDAAKQAQKRNRLSRPLASYLRTLVGPQRFVSQIGGPLDRGKTGPWAEVVTKEPTYVSPTPFRGVAKLGSAQVAFALDAVAKDAKGYDRAYVDLNANGDLTDEQPLAALRVPPGKETGFSAFPTIEVSLDVDGQKIAFPVALSADCQRTPQASVATVSLYSAVAREGEITQGNRKIRLVLIDRDSNGRFNDPVSVHKVGSKLDVAEGDLLLVNPNPRNERYGSATMGRDRFFVNNTVCIGRNFYKLDVSPSGDRLSLEPTEMTLGNVTNASPAYRAVVYNDQGVLVIGGLKGQKVPLPTGEWKLAQYTIDATALTGGARTAITASFSGEGESVKVEKGKTTELPFGAPYHAEVTASPDPKKKGLSLALNIVGVGGERCTNFQVNGHKPPKPKFQIRDKDGKTVYQGEFEYG